MVAGAVLVTRPDAGMGLSLAGNAQPQAGVAASAAIVIDRNAVDDAQLARYLSAHKEFPAAAALGPSPGFLRNAAYESSPR
jgi:hypothetical protein